MGYSYYLVDEVSKLAIHIGRGGSEIFEEESIIYNRHREFLMNEVADNENYWGLLDVKLQDLTVGQYKKLVTLFETGLDLSSLSSSRLALEYKYRNQEKELKVVGESEIGEVPDYTVIE